MEINGRTRVIALFAYPSTHVRTPSFFNPLCDQQGRNAVLVPWQVHPGQLSAAWDGLRHVESLAGVLVTIPHKTAAAGLCDRLDGVAKLLGVVNAACRTASLLGAYLTAWDFCAAWKRPGIASRASARFLSGRVVPPQALPTP